MGFVNARRVVELEVGVDPYAAMQARVWESQDRLLLEGRGTRRAVRFGFGEPSTSFDDLGPQQHWPGAGGSATTMGDYTPALPAPSLPGSPMQDLLGEFGL